ncbi:MAG: sugar phosphate isomerase/epimerase family protein [Candidatus Peregrinibacteria bacterium]
MTAIYASTACLGGEQPLGDRLKLYREHGITAIELGAHVTIAGELPPHVLEAGSYLLHNYFPPPAEPFILNLASANEAIRQRSITLVNNALAISASLGAPVYSVHAGFVTDPTLDFVFPLPSSPQSAHEALRRFADSVRTVLPIAEQNGVKLLIENNVCEPKNRGKLLLQTPEEFQEFFHMIFSPQLGILVDTGHLNVTAKTFGFDCMDFIDALSPKIGAFHLHDNDGSADQHRPVSAGGWVTDLLQQAQFRTIPWIVEAKFPGPELLAAHIALLADL